MFGGRGIELVFARPVRKLKMTPNRLFFLHLPKTAGTSVSAYLDRHYSEEQIYSVSPPDYRAAERRLAAMSESEQGAIRLVSGHFGYGIDRFFRDSDHTYFTILRDPVDRMMSLYHYVLTTPSHPLHAPVIGDGLDIVEFASSGLHPELDNCQTRMLSGREQTHWQDGPEKCSEVDLGRAVARLRDERMVVGLYEELPASLYQLDRAMGWVPGRLERRNVTRKRSTLQSLSPSQRAAICETSALDVQLYEAGVEMFRNASKALPAIQRIRFSMTRLGLGRK